MKEILEKLNLNSINPGSWSGDTALQSDNEKLIESINPSTKEVIASVKNTTNEEYEQILSNANEAFKEWRNIPAPVRGDAVRRIGDALREHKDALGSLISIEMGKIKAEGGVKRISIDKGEWKAKFKIFAVPTIIIFNGEEVERFSPNIMMQVEATREDVQNAVDEILMESF